MSKGIQTRPALLRIGARVARSLTVLLAVAVIYPASGSGQDSLGFQSPAWFKEPDVPRSPITLVQYELEELLDELEESPGPNDKGESMAEKPAATEDTEDDDTTSAGAEDRRLGEAPEDTSQLFLRQATVLMAPGEMQFDHGFTYSFSEVVTPVFLNDGSLAMERLRSRQWLVPFGIRLGVKENVQAFVDLPFGYAHIERADREQDDFAKTLGIGDLSAGLSFVLQSGEDEKPDVIGSVSFSAPTGDDPFGIGANDPALGTGFWGITGNINAVRSYDPVVLFGGVGYSHFFNRTFFGSDIQLGESFFYSFGMGMGINEEITLSTALVGSYQTDTSFDGVRFPGSSTEPISLRMAITGTMFQCHIVEPFVRFGLTDDAANANFGIIITRL
jgi:hypothetical protein